MRRLEKKSFEGRRLLRDALCCGWATRGCCRSFHSRLHGGLGSGERERERDRQKRRSRSGGSISGNPPIASADGLICNSISHNVISLAVTRSADKGDERETSFGTRAENLNVSSAVPFFSSLSSSFLQPHSLPVRPRTRERHMTHDTCGVATVCALGVCDQDRGPDRGLSL